MPPYPPLSERLKTARLAAKMSQRQLADKLRVITGIATVTGHDVYRWEKGRRTPTAWLPALAIALGVDVDDLCGDTASDVDAALTSPRAPQDHSEDDDDVKRRELMRLGLLGIATGSPSDAIRHAVDLALPDLDVDLDDWEVLLLDHSHAILTQPPEAVHQAILGDLAVAGHQLDRLNADRSRSGKITSRITDLRRIVARLASQAANTTARLGVYEESRQWWVTSRRAADASGDLMLAARIRGVEAAFALYAPRPIESVLVLTGKALRIAGNKPAGMLCAGGARAQALAVAGRGTEAKQTLTDLTEAAAEGVDGGHGWTPDTLPFVAAWVHAHTGGDAECEQASEHVVTCSSSYQNIANARLLPAIAAVQRGDYKRALLMGSEIINGLDPAFRTRMITATGRRVLDAIPPSARESSPLRPAVRDYQELLSGST